MEKRRKIEQIGDVSQEHQQNKWAKLASLIGDKLAAPLYKIKDLSESSSPYPLILLSVILMAFSLSIYLLLFRNQSILNFGFVQAFISMVITYFLCRKMSILPYLISEKNQKYLKISSAILVAGIICLVQSWNCWPKKNTLFVLSFLPILEWGFEVLNSSRRTTYGLDGQIRT
jgi:hypothetical protein